MKQSAFPRWPAAVTAMLAATALFYPALRLGPRRRWVAFVGILLLIAGAPLLVPIEAAVARLMVALVAIVMAMKLWDAHFGARRGTDGSFGSYLGFVCNPTALVWRKIDFEPRPTVRENALQFAAAISGLIASGALLFGIRQVEWRQHPFWIEHAAKAGVLVLGFTALMAAVVHLVRLLGGVARDFANAPWKARTPAEFWRRYNRSIGQFFQEDVFRPACRRVPAALAVLLAFGISGLLHEYAFAVALGRVQGYVTLFFLLQGVAVLATWRLQPKGWFAMLSIGATMIFLLASSVLLFASLDSVAQLYAQGVPVWLAP